MNLVRLTFNNSATQTHLSEKIVGVRVRMTDRDVLVKPTRQTDAHNSLPLEARGGRGKQIIFTGEKCALLLASIGKDAKKSPYFTLEEVDDAGWLRLQHHNDDEPPRHLPHARVWVSKDGSYTQTMRA